jgi:hypothetical protein
VLLVEKSVIAFFARLCIRSRQRNGQGAGRRDENNRDYVRWCFVDAKMAKALATAPL